MTFKYFRIFLKGAAILNIQWDSCNFKISNNITKTYLFNFNPLTSHFYIVKLGFTGVNVIFLIFSQNIDCGIRLNRLAEAVLTRTHNLRFEQKYEQIFEYLSENFQFLARWNGSNEYSQSTFWAEIWTNIWVFIWKLSAFLVVKFSIYLNRHVFQMKSTFWQKTAVFKQN